MEMEVTFFLVFVLGVTTVFGFDGCPFYFPKNREATLRDRCYTFIGNQRLGYNAADQSCRSAGGVLAMPKTSAVNSLLAGTMRRLGMSHRAWIGLNDKREESVFRWEDGSRLRYPSGFHMFVDHDEGPHDKYRPLRLIEDCVALDHSGSWHDYTCSGALIAAKRNYICEFKLKLTTPRPSTTTATSTTDAPTTATSTTSPSTTTQSTTTKTTNPATTKSTATTAAVTTESTTQEPTTAATTTTTTAPPTIHPSTVTSSPPSTATATTKPTTTTDATTTTTDAATTGDAASTTSTTQTVPTSTSTEKVETTRCPILECDLECGLSGYVVDDVTGCLKCQCDE